MSCLRFQRLHLPSQVIHSLAPPSSYGNHLCWRHLCPHCAKTWAENNAHPIADPDLPRAILLSLPLLCGVSTYLYLSICVFSCSPGPPTAETVHCPSIIRRAVMWLQLRALSQRPAARVSTFASFDSCGQFLWRFVFDFHQFDICFNTDQSRKCQNLPSV